MKKIDFKSILVGFCLCIGLIVITGSQDGTLSYIKNLEKDINNNGIEISFNAVQHNDLKLKIIDIENRMKELEQSNSDTQLLLLKILNRLNKLEIK